MKKNLFILLFFTVMSSFAAEQRGYPWSIGRGRNAAPAVQQESKEGEHLLYPFNIARGNQPRPANQTPLLEREGYDDIKDLEGQRSSRASSVSSTIGVACPVCLEENMARAIPGNGRVKLKCGHMICSRCYAGGIVGRISQFVERDEVVPEGSFACPLCRAEFAIPVEAIAELRGIIDARDGMFPQDEVRSFVPFVPENERLDEDVARCLNSCGKIAGAALLGMLGFWMVTGQIWGMQ